MSQGGAQRDDLPRSLVHRDDGTSKGVPRIDNVSARNVFHGQDIRKYICLMRKNPARMAVISASWETVHISAFANSSGNAGRRQHHREKSFGTESHMVNTHDVMIAFVRTSKLIGGVGGAASQKTVTAVRSSA